MGGLLLTKVGGLYRRGRLLGATAEGVYEGWERRAAWARCLKML